MNDVEKSDEQIEAEAEAVVDKPEHNPVIIITFYRGKGVGLQIDDELSSVDIWGAAELLRFEAHERVMAQKMYAAQQAAEISQIAQSLRKH